MRSWATNLFCLSIKWSSTAILPPTLLALWGVSFIFIVVAKVSILFTEFWRICSRTRQIISARNEPGTRQHVHSLHSPLPGVDDSTRDPVQSKCVAAAGVAGCLIYQDLLLNCPLGQIWLDSDVFSLHFLGSNTDWTLFQVVGKKQQFEW